MSEKKWNIWTGENAPWWATLGMLILWCAVAWKAHVRNNHLVMILTIIYLTSERVKSGTN